MGGVQRGVRWSGWRWEMTGGVHLLVIGVGEEGRQVRAVSWSEREIGLCGREKRRKGGEELGQAGKERGRKEREMGWAGWGEREKNIYLVFCDGISFFFFLFSGYCSFIVFDDIL
jgi:hypothetical protein